MSSELRPPTLINQLASYLYTLDAAVLNVPFFIDRPKSDTTYVSDYHSVGETWSEAHKGVSKLYAHKSICYLADADNKIARKRTLTTDANAPYVNVSEVNYPTPEIELMYVRLGFNTNVLVLRCMVHAINAVAPVTGYLNNKPMYEASPTYCNLFQMTGASDIVNVRLQLETTAMAALTKLCGYVTNNYSEVHIDFIDAIFCKCKLLTNINQANEAFVVKFMQGLCANATIDIVGYENICACLGKGATVPGGLTEEQQWQKDFRNDKIKFVCARKACVGDETGRVYQFKPNPACPRYEICSQSITANALKYEITNLTLCCGTDCPTKLNGSGALCSGATVQRRQKTTFAWIALVVLLLLLCAVFFK